MSFSNELKALRRGNYYDLRTPHKISTRGDENTGEAEKGIIEGSEENSIRLSPELVNERTEANLEPLHAQISALTEMMDRQIQSNSAKKSTTANSRAFGHQHESPYSDGPGSSKFPTVAPLITTGYLPGSYYINKMPMNFDAGLSEKTGDHFLRHCIPNAWKIIIFPPVEMGRCEQQRLKRKNYSPDHQDMKMQSEENTKRDKTVGTSARLELKLQVITSLAFV